MDTLRNKTKRSKRLWFAYQIIMVAFIGIYFTLFLGVFSYWVSLGSWAVGIALSGAILYTGYRTLSKLVVKRFLAFILLCALMTMPLFTAFAVIRNQNTAQNLSTQTSVNYFKNQLGRSYNYTELIVWENKHLNFTYADIERNTDPVKIYEYRKGRCEEFATLYATLCISQGYRCRIVHSVYNDHVFNEVMEANGTWIRVDASLNDTSSRAIGYPMFFEKEEGWRAPILSLAFENSSITEVTSTYRSDGFTILSPTTIIVLASLFAFLMVTITKELITSPKPTPAEDSNDEEKEKISPEEEKERDKLIYEIIVERHKQELQRTSDLDSKANNTIGFSGLLATLIATVVSYLPKGSYTLLFSAPLSLLIVSAILGLLAYRVKTYEAIEPRKFIEEYKDKTLKNTLREYVGTIADSTLKNHKVHEDKAKLIKYASALLVLAISLFFVIAISNWLM